ncbi:hypothetical protein ATO6_15325 [Oceanicola sp. 22II-s10i]|nr:hypothetical protein ATO6_15325 [Oceanicola sp. 22II-s10i]
MKIVRAVLLGCTALVVPAPARAEPVSAFFLAYTGATGASAAAAAALYPTITAVGSFLGTNLLGNLLLNVGLAYLTRPRQKAQDTEAARINSRTEAASRKQLVGPVAVGGEGGIFGEFDEDGNFWYIVAHGDAEMAGDPSYILDDIPVTLSDATDGFTAGDVLTDDFCLNGDHNKYEGSGTRVPYFRLYTVSPSASAVYGTKPAAFTTAFPNLPADFYLAGVTYTIVRVRAVPLDHRHKVYRWRGVRGLGEPNVVLYADFNRVYDHREVGHDIDDDTTWTASGGNPANIWAWWRTNPFGRARPMSEIAWDKVAEAADVCDETVLDRSASPVPRYRCGVAIDDSSGRAEGEQEILKTMDAFVAYDDEGRAYPVPGKYVAPTLSFDGQRDIYTSATEIIDDGETAVDGVVVRYVSPLHGYTLQDCAPWQNPEYYDDGREPNYHFETIAGCQNHNQAFRLAGALGMRKAAAKKAALGSTCKGVLAKGRRAITLDLDADFTGVFEIASRVQEDENGLACGFAVVPLASDRWDGAGQSEGVPPQLVPALEIDSSLEIAANVTITQEAVETSNGTAYRIRAEFDAPARPDRFFRFRLTEVGETDFEYFSTDMDELVALSPLVAVGATYDVQWQTTTAGGRATEWAADVGGSETEYEITIIADNAPGDLTGVAATAGPGRVSFTGTAGEVASHVGVKVYRAAVGAGFGSASDISGTIGSAASAPFSVTVGDPAATDIMVGGDFASASGWTGTNWTISGGKATHAAVDGNGLYRSDVPVDAGEEYRWTFKVADRTGGSVYFRMNGDSNVFGTLLSANGSFGGTLTAPTGLTALGVFGNSSFDGSVDDLTLVKQTASSITVGPFDFWIVPVAFDGTEGTPDGPHTLVIP